MFDLLVRGTNLTRNGEWQMVIYNSDNFDQPLIALLHWYIRVGSFCIKGNETTTKCESVAIFKWILLETITLAISEAGGLK